MSGLRNHEMQGEVDQALDRALLEFGRYRSPDVERCDDGLSGCCGVLHVATSE